MSTWAEPQAAREEVRIYPLGGLGEIGLNMTALECRGRIVIIDTGIMFPDHWMHGIDLVIPDATFLFENVEKIAAILITHGHEDHIGALPFLLEDLGSPPIYGSSFSLALIQEKLDEHELSADLNPVEPLDRVELDPFAVTFIRVAHSIPEGFGLKIETPLGNIIHSGDYKVDHGLTGDEATDLAAFARAGEEGVLLLMADSTNVERPGSTLSEATVERNIERIFREAKGRILVACFASNVRRVAEVVDAARKFNRRVHFTGRSLETNVRIARELKLIDLPEWLEVTPAELKELSPRQTCIITTGSQGEPRAALTRIATGQHKQIKIGSGDVVILSSRFIPGHERAITRVINHLYRLGAEVLYEHIAKVHSSGHAYQDELKLLINLTRPRYYLPVHGEVRHLVRNGRLAQEMGIPAENVLQIENGDVVSLKKTGAEVVDRIETGRVFVDGKGVGDVGEVVLRDRRRLSNDGVVVVLLVLDRQTGEVISGPEVVSRGFVFEDEQADLLAEAKETVLDIVEGMDEPDWEWARLEIRRGLRRLFNKGLDRRPMILTTILPM